MEEKAKVRIDKWLWSVRLFKTRSLAAEACDRNRISIAGSPVKASRIVKVGEAIDIHRGPWHQQVEVLALLDKRVNAELAKQYVRDISIPEEIERYKQHQAAKAAYNIKSGTGRPTKKDRRDMEEFLGDW